ncbi:hypothetical protein NMY22_g16275 [Coprinellus aureogranulatus]|nr:hypothetical protein NMY22_g16275 [Coprinellus aureogranulatus]
MLTYRPRNDDVASLSEIPWQEHGIASAAGRTPLLTHYHDHLTMPDTTSNFNAGYNSGTISQVNNYNSNVANHVEIQVGASDPALKELYAHTTPGAMHNSEDRAEAPKCHLETRKAVQENIFGWISHREGEGEPQQLLWLTGPAGTGKTAIMGTVSDKLDERGQLVASFYFASYTGSSSILR